MRPVHVLLVLAVAALFASAVAAPAYYARRPAGLADETFVFEDPERRAAWAEERDALGTAHSAYQEMANEDGADHEAAWNAVRTFLLISGTGYQEPAMPQQLALFLTEVYPRIRPHVDPDGKRLRETVREWQKLRLKSEQLYVKAGTAIWLAARNGVMGREKVRVFLEKGPFYQVFFSYVAAERPHWGAVEPVVEHYLKGDDLRGRVEAGAALLEAHALYGVGAELLERSRRDIRAAFREYKAALEPGVDEMERMRAESCVFGMALLARAGHEQERRVLADMWKRRVEYPDVAAVLRVARPTAGLRRFDTLRPGTSKFELLPQQAKEYYFRGLALHYLDVHDDPARKEEAQWTREVLEDGTLDAYSLVASTCFRALARFEPERWEKAAKGNPLYRLRAAARAPGSADWKVVAPWLAHTDPGYAGLAAAILRDDLPALPLLQD